MGLLKKSYRKSYYTFNAEFKVLLYLSDMFRRSSKNRTINYYYIIDLVLKIDSGKAMFLFFCVQIICSFIL